MKYNRFEAVNVVGKQILPHYACGAANDAALVHLNRLLSVGRDIAQRVTGTEEFSHSIAASIAGSHRYGAG